MDKWTGPRHPSPSEDSRLWEGLKQKENDSLPDLKQYLFGFSSIAQLRAWFFDDEVLRHLHEKGFVLVEFDCKIVNGNSQVVSLKEDVAAASKKESSLLSLLAEKKVDGGQSL